MQFAHLELSENPFVELSRIFLLVQEIKEDSIHLKINTKHLVKRIITKFIV